jgi:hypothetical protein
MVGQQVPLVRLLHGPQLLLVIQIQDGSHAAVPADWTNFAPANPSPSHPTATLLNLERLRQMAQFVDAHLATPLVEPPPES